MEPTGGSVGFPYLYIQAFFLTPKKPGWKFPFHGREHPTAIILKTIQISSVHTGRISFGGLFERQC
jgi:hypothetical protein